MKVSIILTTKNNERTIHKCISSITENIYKNFEIIIVDNFSDDKTKEIIEWFPKSSNIHFYEYGPERNLQRPYGFEKSSWDIVYFIDSDMYLENGLIDEIVQILEKHTQIKALIVPEINIWGHGYWSRVKAFERSLYHGDDDVEAARVFRRSLYEKLWGYNKKLVSWEDWDLSDRAREFSDIYRTKKRVEHDEWEIDLIQLLKKKFYYWSKIPLYIKENSSKKTWNKIYFFRKSFYKNWRSYIRHPLLFIWFFIMINLSLFSFTLWFLSWKYAKKHSS